ncbi:MAG: S8 family serine peptidase, partial [bacterium]
LAVHDGEVVHSANEYSKLTQPGAVNSGLFEDGHIKYLINATETQSVLNGKAHVGVLIVVDPSYKDIENLSFDLVMKGSGSFDAWLFPDKPARTIQFTSIAGDYSGGKWKYIPGDRIKNIAIPATSPDVISVVGYSTRNQWTSGALTWIFNGQHLGEILSFSSSGPTANPQFTGQKPEIAAPGGMIASAKSGHAQIGSEVILDDGEHYVQAGTSMAAPFVAGTIALMFEANHNFTQDDVKGFLLNSAYVDDNVGNVPNDRWGHGKLDVLGAMKLAINGSASGYFDSTGSGSIGVPLGDASSGNSSCQLTVQVSSSFCGAEICLLLIFLMAAGFLRKFVVISYKHSPRL